MTHTALGIAEADVLRKGIQGDVLLPADQGYDEARVLWNGSIDRRPAVIVRALCAADVSAAITFARQHDLEIAVRGGGHSTAGLSGVDDGLVIDLSLINSVETDVAARRCRVGGGATIAQRDIATQKHGLAAPAGIVGHTGIGGLTLGGGMGWLTRKHGLSIDNLVSVEIVTADGEIHRASDAHEPKLFWAIRGGGGNFGVVTEFEFQLHDVGPMVSFGLLWWPIEQAADVLRLTRNLFASMSTEMNIIVAGASGPPAPWVPEAYHHAPGIALAVTGFAPDGEHARIIERINAQLAPLAQMTTPIPYANLQQMFDEANAFGVLAYDKAAYVEELTDGAISVIADQLARKSSPRSGLFVYRLDGAYSAVREEATAFGGGRSPRYALFLIAIGDDPAGLAVETTWVRDFWTALQPHAMGAGSYLNGEAEFPQDKVHASYGETKYTLLSAIKHRYDPDNVFHHNANITPMPGGGGPPAQRAGS